MDWRKAMTPKESEQNQKLSLCNFDKIVKHFEAGSERTKVDKATLKQQNDAIIAEYGFCTIDDRMVSIVNRFESDEVHNIKSELEAKI